MKYLCVTKCYHGGRLYEVGEVVEFDKANPAPCDKEGNVRHFEAVGKAVDAVDEVDKVDPPSPQGAAAGKQTPSPKASAGKQAA